MIMIPKAREQANTLLLLPVSKLTFSAAFASASQRATFHRAACWIESWLAPKSTVTSQLLFPWTCYLLRKLTLEDVEAFLQCCFLKLQQIPLSKLPECSQLSICCSSCWRHQILTARSCQVLWLAIFCFCRKQTVRTQCFLTWCHNIKKKSLLAEWSFPFPSQKYLAAHR